MVKTCPQCGRIFLPRSAAHFACSPACAGLYAGAHRRCVHCARELEDPNRAHRFCGDVCRRAYQFETRKRKWTCASCGRSYRARYEDLYACCSDACLAARYPGERPDNIRGEPERLFLKAALDAGLFSRTGRLIRTQQAEFERLLFALADNDEMLRRWLDRLPGGRAAWVEQVLVTISRSGLWVE